VGLGFASLRRACICDDCGLFSNPPMSLKSTFKCLHCNEEHRCDPRNRGRQRFCSKPDCRRASKAASQRQWVARPENQNYFRGAENCERVRQWRLAHPGYWRNKRPAGTSTLQDPSIPQSVENQPLTPSGISDALQEVLLLQPALIVGLIAVMTGHELQDDIAVSARSFINRGRDILRMARGSPDIPDHENQAHPVSRAAAPRASPV
jgi:hypothetical protein